MCIKSQLFQTFPWVLVEVHMQTEQGWQSLISCKCKINLWPFNTTLESSEPCKRTMWQIPSYLLACVLVFVVAKYSLEIYSEYLVGGLQRTERMLAWWGNIREAPLSLAWFIQACVCEVLNLWSVILLFSYLVSFLTVIISVECNWWNIKPTPSDVRRILLHDWFIELLSQSVPVSDLKWGDLCRTICYSGRTSGFRV